MNKELKFTDHLIEKLERLETPPEKLYFRGTPLGEFRDRPIVAIVGTRKPTPYGRNLAELFASELAKAGVVIVSGLAYGIDSLAQKACLAAGGQTIAVLPSGIDNIYPAAHEPLARTITEKGGSLISEYPANHKPYRHDFLHRNRLIAALSDVVLIPEAATGSGSLNTAKHAKRLDIPVCVIPGPVTNPMSKGTNGLLKSHALAVTEPADLLKLLGISSGGVQTTLDLSTATKEEATILKNIAAGVHEAQSLQAISGLTTTEFQSTLSLLEIDGRAVQDPSGNWHLS